MFLRRSRKLNEELKQESNEKVFLEKDKIPTVLYWHVLDFLSLPTRIALQPVSKGWQTLIVTHDKWWNNVVIHPNYWVNVFLLPLTRLLLKDPFPGTRHPIFLNSLFSICGKRLQHFEVHNQEIGAICTSLLEHKITNLKSLKLHSSCHSLVTSLSLAMLLQVVEQNRNLVVLTTPWYFLLSCKVRPVVEKPIYKEIRTLVPSMDETSIKCAVCKKQEAGCPCCHRQCARCRDFPCSDCGVNKCEQCLTTYCSLCGSSPACAEGRCVHYLDTF